MFFGAATAAAFPVLEYSEKPKAAAIPGFEKRGIDAVSTQELADELTVRFAACSDDRERAKLLDLLDASIAPTDGEARQKWQSALVILSRRLRHDGQARQSRFFQQLDFSCNFFSNSEITEFLTPSGFPTLDRMIGLSLIRRGESYAALLFLETAVKNAPTEMNLLSLSALYSELGRPDDAAKLLRSNAEKFKRRESMIAAGDRMLACEDWEGAAFFFNRIDAAQRTEEVEVRLHLRRIAADYLRGRNAEALEKLLRLDPDGAWLAPLLRSAKDTINVKVSSIRPLACPGINGVQNITVQQAAKDSIRIYSQPSFLYNSYQSGFDRFLFSANSVVVALAEAEYRNGNAEVRRRVEAFFAASSNRYAVRMLKEGVTPELKKELMEAVRQPDVDATTLRLFFRLDGVRMAADWTDEQLEAVLESMVKRHVGDPKLLMRFVDSTTVSTERKQRMLELATRNDFGVEMLFAVSRSNSKRPEIAAICLNALGRMLVKKPETEMEWMFEHMFAQCALSAGQYDLLIRRIVDNKSIEQPWNELSFCSARMSRQLYPNQIFPVWTSNNSILPGMSAAGEWMPVNLSNSLDQNLLAAARKGGVSEFGLLILSCAAGETVAALEQLNAIVESNRKLSLPAMLNLMVVARFLDQKETAFRIASTLFRTESLSFDVRDTAAFLMLETASPETPKELLAAAVEHLIDVYPEDIRQRGNYLRNRGRIEVADLLEAALKKRPAPPEDRNLFLMNFKDRWDSDRTRAGERLRRILLNSREPRNFSNVRYQFGSMGRGPGSTALREFLKEVSAGTSTDDLWCTAILSDFLNENAAAAAAYEKLLAQTPGDDRIAVRLFVVRNASGAPIGGELSERIGTIPLKQLTSQLENGSGSAMLTVFELAVERQEITSMAAFELSSLLYRIGGYWATQGVIDLTFLSPDVMVLNGKDELEKRRIRLLGKILQKTVGNPAQERVAFAYMVGCLDFLPPMPEMTAVARRLCEGATECLEAEEYLWFVGMNDPAAARRMAENLPSLSDAVATMEQWRHCGFDDFKPFFDTLLKKTDGTNWRRSAVMERAFLRCATAWRLKIDPFLLNAQLVSRKMINEQSSVRRMDYMARVLSADEMRQVFHRYVERLRTRSAEVDKRTDEFSMDLLVQGISMIPLDQGGRELRLAFLHEVYSHVGLFPSNGNGRFLFLCEALPDPSEAFVGTATFGSMREFISAGWPNLWNLYFPDKVRTSIRKRMEQTPEADRTFGMELLSIAPSDSAEQTERILLEHRAEWDALSAADRARLVGMLWPAENWNTGRNWMPKDPKLRDEMLASRDLSYEMLLDDLLKRKDVSNFSINWELQSQAFSACFALLERRPEKVGAALKLIFDAAGKNGSFVNAFEWFQRENRFSFALVRLLAANQVRISGGMITPSALDSALNRELDKGTAFADLVRECRTILPGALTEAVMMRFLLAHPAVWDDPHTLPGLEKLRDEAPTAPELILAVRLLKLGKQPLTDEETAFLKKKLRTYLNDPKGESPMWLLTRAPEFFDDPEQMSVLLSGQIAALNRKTGNNPERDPEGYFTLVRLGMSLRGKLPEAALRKTLEPLLKNSLDTFPLLGRDDARRILPYLLSYTLWCNDTENFEILREHTDLVDATFAESVADDTANGYSAHEKAAFARAFPKSGGGK